MKVRTGGTSGTSAESDLLTFFHSVSFLHGELREMQIQCQQTLSVIEDNAVPFEEQRACKQYCAAVDSVHRSSGCDAEVEALVCALHRSVEDALHAEHIRDGRFDWRLESALPFAR